MRKKKETTTQILGRVLRKAGEDEDAVEQVLSDQRDSSSAGRAYKAVKAYLWGLFKQVLSKWYVLLALALGGGATFREYLQALF